MKTDVKEKIWQILEEHAGAYPNNKDNFLANWPECTEYRFCGSLGFGGKIWHNCRKVYINCYSEDLNPKKQKVIDKVNGLIQEIIQ